MNGTLSAPPTRLIGIFSDVQHLGRAARYPARPRRSGAMLAADAATALVTRTLRMVLDALTPGPRSPHSRGHGGGPADPVQAEAMRAARDKLADAPHLLACIRAGAARPVRGQARSAARQAADGYVQVSRALRPARLRHAASVLAERRAPRGHWVLHTAAELGDLARLPADPARHGFSTAALHRPPPVTARNATPERATGQAPGWDGTAWTSPGYNATTRDEDDAA
jgi:hypothetical protein